MSHADSSKPFMMATHRTLRADENPIDIIKEFFKAGGGGSLQLTDGKTNSKKQTKVGPPAKQINKT